ncbi:YdeI/OmpD-associated family protein [Olsenella sp. DNF00959]|uniref:YdeI/OmpD-associated family protein n=1 Tax=Olsenella sp. DNF00959 TaxID=1476999 RepID=UPI0018D2656C
MPQDVLELLESRGLRADYDQRPAYQRNDYLGWIDRAKLPATRERRIAQMLDSLRAVACTWAWSTVRPARRRMRRRRAVRRWAAPRPLTSSRDLARRTST